MTPELDVTTTNVNLNAAHCIQEASHWGYTEYVNICNGLHSRVEWGGVDWAGAAFVSVFLLLVILGVIALFLFFLKEAFDGY